MRKSRLFLAVFLIAPIAFGLVRASTSRAANARASSRVTTESLDGIRGITIGPIENAYHPDVGYGSRAYDDTLVECQEMGATWVAITPFGRVANLEGRGVDPSFEAPYEKNKRDVARAIDMAHARGLHVMLVPHLWVESFEWRAKIDPKTDEGWAAWKKSYSAWVHGWAEIAEKNHVEMMSVGVELRSWVTTPRAPSFLDVITEIRAVYKGLLTYSANWDDVEDTVILGAVDVIGINAFFPLAEKEGASFDELKKGGERVRDRVKAVHDAWQKPVLFTEVGYTTRADPAVKPWEWPDGMKAVKVDQKAQADAYLALLAPFLDEPWFLGFFVWRVYADPQDVSQEAEWGFSPRGKLSELVVRDAFASHFAHDQKLRAPGFLPAAREPGFFP